MKGSLAIATANKEAYSKTPLSRKRNTKYLAKHKKYAACQVLPHMTDDR